MSDHEEYYDPIPLAPSDIGLPTGPNDGGRRGFIPGENPYAQVYGSQYADYVDPYRPQAYVQTPAIPVIPRRYVGVTPSERRRRKSGLAVAITATSLGALALIGIVLCYVAILASSDYDEQTAAGGGIILIGLFLGIPTLVLLIISIVASVRARHRVTITLTIITAVMWLAGPVLFVLGILHSVGMR